jgi:sugar (pentulose or hexulose) kinase
VTVLTLGVDLGSHDARAVVLDDDAVVASAAEGYGPPPPPARRDASSWWNAFAGAVRKLPAELRAQLGALAVTGVRGAVVGVDDDGVALTAGYPDFDVEAVAPARQLAERYGDAFLARTACFAFPLAGLPKMMLHAGDGRIRAWLGPPDLVTARLTGRRTLGAASAFRFGILRADGTGIDRKLLAEVGVDPDCIPPLVDVGTTLGLVADGAVAGDLGLRAGLPIVSAPGDVPAALYAVAGEQAHCAFVNLGTTIVATAGLSAGTIVAGMSCEVLPHGRRAIETGSGAGGVTLDWAAALLGVAPGALDALAARASRTAVPTLDPELLDPWGTGSGGALHGIVPGTGRAELAAATLDAVADAASRALDELVAGGGALERVVLGGGVSRSRRIVERLVRTRRERVTVAFGRELAAEGAARVAAAELDRTPSS